MKSAKYISILVLLAMLSTLVLGCQPAAPAAEEAPAEEAPAEEAPAEEAVVEEAPAEPKEPVYFAWYGPLTGDTKQYGDTEKVAVEIALKDINEGMGGVLDGRELIVDFYDDKNDPKETVLIAAKILGEEKYTATIGGFSSTPTMAAAPTYQEAQMVNYSPTASHADYSAMGDYLFRNTPTQAIETTNYAEYVFNELGYKTIFLLNMNDDWGNNIAAIFTDKYEELGGEVLGAETFIPGQTTDFTPMISKAKEAAPEAFFVISLYNDTANILIQADQLDFDVAMILASANLKQELIDIVGDLANGAFMMNAFSPDIDTDRFKHVMEEYTKITGKAGDAFVMQTYDVVMQLATALNEAGSTDNVKLRDTLAGMKDYECLSGTYSMNELGDAVRVLQPIMIVDGAFVNMNTMD